MAPKVKGVKNSKKQIIKCYTQTPKKFFVCCSIAIKVKDDLWNFRWRSYNDLNHLK
jgi:hypothetical protein